MDYKKSGQQRPGKNAPRHREKGAKGSPENPFGPIGKRGKPEKPVGDLDKPSKEGEDFAIDEDRDKSLRGRQDTE